MAAVGAPKARMAGFHGAVGRRHVNLHRKYEVQQENMRFGMVNETISGDHYRLRNQRSALSGGDSVSPPSEFGQQVRDDGPQSHLKKQGTPTMGGLIILTAIVITSLFYIRSYPRIIPILFVTVGFGIIGFLDDYIKIVMKRSEGLNRSRS